MEAVGEWKSKSRIPTFPPPPDQPAAQGKHQFKNAPRSAESNTILLHLSRHLSGSSCIRNELQFRLILRLENATSPWRKSHNTAY
jgi:hypothetical protein